MTKASIFLLAVALLASVSCKPEEQWEALFNEKDLTGWDTYIGPAWVAKSDSTVGRSNIPIGLNIDPQNVFSVVEVDGQPAIRISGEQWGGLSTTQEYCLPPQPSIQMGKTKTQTPRSVSSCILKSSRSVDLFNAATIIIS